MKIRSDEFIIIAFTIITIAFIEIRIIKHVERFGCELQTQVVHMFKLY